MGIDSILQPFQRFGVHLGLKRIDQLLSSLGNPHHKVPIIHVAGTNGKGSVCAYLSSILTQAGYKVGRYTSPHLVDWMERICLNEQPISQEALQSLLLQVINAVNPATETPTQFEVITAAAWLYFAQNNVDIAIVEVGLGGRLDATNVCDRPLVSVIASISREHWQQLGSTLAAIATEKAGIIKPGCPVVVGKLPLEAENVVRSRIAQLNCPAVWVEPATAVLTGRQRATYQNIEYPLPLLGEVQLSNSALAIATVQILQQNGWKITPDAIANGMTKTRWPGRLQWVKYGDRPLLIDGAHNPAAAQALRQYADTLESPITWVIGILSTKDHKEIFTALLRPKDRLYLVPVPDRSSAEPMDLAILAQNICPTLAICETYNDLFSALKAAKSDRLVILCGSLYLIGHFLKTFRVS